MFYFTTAQIDEIEKRLAVRAKKDTDFDPVSSAEEADLVAIIHNGRNVICRLDKLPGRLKAVTYDEITYPSEENLLEAPTAFSVGVLKDLLGIAKISEFDPTATYKKNDYVYYVDENGIARGYFFKSKKNAGEWNQNNVDEINYSTIASRLKELMNQFEPNGLVYVLDSYFTDDKANKAIADEDGKNIKEYYALKSEIPDYTVAIAQLVEGKLDKFSLGAHDLPVWFDSNKEPQVIDSLHTPGDIKSDSNVEAMGGVSAHGHADMSIGGGGSDSDSVKAIKVGESGSPITPDNGIVTLPAYPSTLAELTPDSQHQTVTSSEKADWNDVLDKIPAEATSSNKLADKNYVDTQMASASGTFRGTNTTATTEQELIAWANTLQHNVNDYVFWQKSDTYGNTYFSRYKYDGTTWLYEYDITSTSFTEEQWNAINSGLTARHLGEIDASILALIEEMDTKADKDDLTPIVDALGQHASELEDHSELINENSERIEDLQRDVISQGEIIERNSGYIQGLQSNVTLINQRLDYDSLPLFDPNRQGGYIRGDVVKIVDSGGNAFGYRFIMSHTGAWVEAHTEPLNIWALANPLDIDDTRLNEIINS